MTLEAHQDAAPGEGACEAHRRAHGLAAGVGEAHHLQAGHGVDDLARRLDLELVGEAEGGAVLGDGVGHRQGDHGMAVAEDVRAQAEEVVDVLVAVHVAQARSRALGDERRIRLPAELDGAGAAAGAAGDDLAGDPVELGGAGGVARVRGLEVHGHLMARGLFRRLRQLGMLCMS
jgi:hypothetical protein